jgi:hypothetical protein
MIRVLLLTSVFWLLASSAGCECYSYRNGSCSVLVMRSAMDSQAAQMDMVLSDGTQLHVTAPSSKPDATVVGAVASVFQAVIGVGGMVLRLFGF